MTDLQILDLLSDCQGYIIFGCCLLCFIYSNKLSKPIELFSYYLFSLMLLNYSISTLADFKVNNLAITHFIVIAEFVFLSKYFREILSNNIYFSKYSKFYFGLIGGLIMLNTIYFEKINTFNTNAKVLVLFIIIFLATAFFYDRAKKLMEVDVHERAIRLINSALLLYYSGSFFVYLFYKFTQNNKIFYSNKMLIFNAGLYLVFTIIVLVAILQVVFHREKPLTNLE